MPRRADDGRRPLDLRASAGNHRLRAKLDAGFAAPARVRLEFPAPGKPSSPTSPSASDATLVLPREGRVLRDAPPAATLEALAGVAIGPEDLRTIVAGCGFGGRRGHAGRAFDRGWVAVDAGDATSWLQQVDGAWQLVAARARARSRSATPTFAAGRPATIRLRAAPERRAGEAASVTDLTIRLSQVDINEPLGADVFQVEVPPDADADDARAASRGRPAWPLERRPSSALRVRVARAREGQPRSARARHARRRLSRAAHGLPVDRAARHAALRRRGPGPFALKCRTPGVPLDESNLVWRAAAALWTAHRPRRARLATSSISIEKADPAAGGARRRQRRRGGDAAGARAGLGWRAAAAGARCRRRASAPTSPYFLSGGTALGLGRGEEIYPLVDLPTHWVVIVQPPYGISTAEAYAWYDEDRAAGLREPREPQMLPVPWPTRAAQMINDLEPPVVRRHPEIGALKTVAARGRGGRGGDVRQRVGRLRPVSHPGGRRPGAQAGHSSRAPAPG